VGLSLLLLLDELFQRAAGTLAALSRASLVLVGTPCCFV
jgi:hypothetical protein